MRLYEFTLSHTTASTLNTLQSFKNLQNFYLSGGTALALQLGHRESEDLDFFNKNVFDPKQLQQHLSTYGLLEDVSLANGTLNCFMNGVKLQFLYYPYPLLEPIIRWNSVNISSLIDIACTKLITISMRGSKKDFIDLFFILQQVDLSDLFIKIKEKYKDVDYNYPHILKSLVYFTDANTQPMPKLHKPAHWEKVKLFLIEKVKEYSLF